MTHHGTNAVPWRSVILDDGAWLFPCPCGGQGSNKDGPVRMEWEQKAENHLIVCSAPGNSHLCKSAK